MPRINLLPWREQQRKERKVQFAVALAAAVVAALLTTAAGYGIFRSLISGQEHRNERLRGEIKILDKQIETINNLEQQKQRFVARMDVIEKLQASRSEVVHLFDEVTRTIPDGTYLTSFKQTGNKLKFEGVAQSSTRVSTFIRNISASQWLKDPDLEIVESRKENTLGNSFVLDAVQVDTSGNEADQPAGASGKPAKRISSGSN